MPTETHADVYHTQKDPRRQLIVIVDRRIFSQIRPSVITVESFDQCTILRVRSKVSILASGVIITGAPMATFRK